MTTYRPLDNLEGKTAVITGVTGNIGFATAQRLANKGARIVGIVRRNLEQAQAQLDSLPAADHGPHLALLADVSDRTQVQQAADSIDHCDILIQSTGTTKHIPLHRFDLLSDEYFDQMVRDNLRNYFTVTRAFVPLLKRSPGSVIVNISSLAGSSSLGGSNLAYCAAKAGLDSMTKNLAKTLAPHVRVISISPGVVDTGFVKDGGDDYPNFERIAQLTPLQRIATVEDVAATVEACVTLIRFNTGTIVPVDGGRPL
jgi:short-subunit dehydrogenase